MSLSMASCSFQISPSHSSLECSLTLQRPSSVCFHHILYSSFFQTSFLFLSSLDPSVVNHLNCFSYQNLQLFFSLCLLTHPAGKSLTLALKVSLLHTYFCSRMFHIICCCCKFQFFHLTWALSSIGLSRTPSSIFFFSHSFQRLAHFSPSHLKPPPH